MCGGGGGGGEGNGRFSIFHSGNAFEYGGGVGGGVAGSSHCGWLYDCVNTVNDKIEIFLFQFYRKHTGLRYTIKKKYKFIIHIYFRYVTGDVIYKKYGKLYLQARREK